MAKHGLEVLLVMEDHLLRDGMMVGLTVLVE